ncbi:unnamed protein product [Blepharisma stoltei]|uniref:Nuclear cap-binding protein subunit 3 n=1 Tax=Blepharisma stoltei TaxID=1481888 RepID=A0AAU9JME9_9CILI|nr:unnamed protein product [Blepharisma stoltei]
MESWEEEYRKVKTRQERFGIIDQSLNLNTPEERKKQKERMERFGTQQAPGDKEIWNPSIEPAGEIRPDTLHLYGVDYMSTKEILKHFDGFKPLKVEWLNDSSCNVQFPGPDFALNAFNTNCVENVENLENFENNKRQAVGYYADGKSLPIYIRFSTTNDVKNDETKPKDSKYYKWKKQQNIKNKAISRRNNKQKFRKRKNEEDE